jgi:hypothetical protein
MVSTAHPIVEWLRDARFAPGAMLAAAPVLPPVRLRDNEAAEIAAAPTTSIRVGQVEVVVASGAFDGDAVARPLAVLLRYQRACSTRPKNVPTTRPNCTRPPSVW